MPFPAVDHPVDEISCFFEGAQEHTVILLSTGHLVPNSSVWLTVLSSQHEDQLALCSRD